MSNIRVMLVATSPVVRAGLSAVVTANQKMTVVGSESDLDLLPRSVKQLQPDVVLLDFTVSLQQSAWEKFLLIQQEQDSLAIIIIVEVENINLDAALRCGVRGILSNTSTESEIIAAIEATSFGLVVLHPDAVELLLMPKTEKLVSNPVQMTTREIEVLLMVASGLGNKAIAKRLHISEHTVKFHISSIFQKLSVSTRTEAVTVGVRLGLILL